MKPGRRLPPALRIALLIAAAVPVAGLVMAACTHLGWWPGQLAQHWTPQLAILSLPFWIWQGRQPIIGGGLAVLGAVTLWPAIAAAHAPRSEAPTGQTINVMSANIYVRADHSASLRLLEGDVVAVIETKDGDREALRNDPRWPHQRWIGPVNLGGVALLSRFPMRSKELDMLDAPGIDAVIEMPWGRTRVIAVHTWSPRNRQMIERNLQQLHDLAGLAATEPGPLLILGDLNASPGHPGIVALREAGMRPAHDGSPATWPSWLGPFGITIDYGLVRGLRLGGTETVDLPGSDHHGIRLQLSR